jgi:pimeloyl-ACP methyl ester carboxylesterase
MPVAFDRLGDGDPLVLIHGVGTSRVIWTRVLPALSERRTVIAVDLPGFGDSPPAGPGFALPAVAERVADATAKAAGGPYDLLGHSLGGAVAVTLAAARPDTVRRLVLAAPAGFAPRPAPIARAGGALAGPFLSLRRQLAAPLLRHALARRIALAGAIADGSRLSAADARRMLYASRGASRIGAAVSEVAAADLGDELRGLAMPIGLIWGERDRIIPIGTVREIARVKGELPVETIPEAGHVAHFERPAEFAAAVDRLLATL